MTEKDITPVGVRIYDSKRHKFLRSPNYNFNFSKETGFFMRWGKTEKDDPDFSPFGPEILDLEISSGGDCLGKCKYCYKSNGGNQPTYNMTFEEFKTIIDKMPPTLTQIAFGIMNISTNPDFFRMMEYARDKGIIPNYTTHGLDVTDEAANRTAELCGAAAVSLVNKKKTFEAIRKFLKRKMKQINIHYMLSEETYDKAFIIIEEITSDPTLKGFNAIVFLQYKAKGRNPDDFHSILDIEKYKKLIAFCEEKRVKYGFDSCSTPLFLECIIGRKDEKLLEACAEPCESGLFSSYINCRGQFFVCSFAENEDNWQEGIDVLNCNNFLQDIWYNERLINWRKRLIENNRNCPIYDLQYV